MRNNVDVWTREIEARGLDAILITASGCGTTIKDYGFMLRTDPAYRDKAEKVSANWLLTASTSLQFPADRSSVACRL